MIEFSFKAVWVHNFADGYTNEAEIIIIANDAKTARVRAFKKAMEINKNMTYKDEHFYEKWTFNGVHLTARVKVSERIKGERK